MSHAKTAVLFPGQGSQYIGMGSDFVEAGGESLALMETAERVSGLPLQRLCFEGPMEELTKAECLQPAITAVNLLCWQAVKAAGIKVDYFAGHSLGEYSALNASGALGLEDTFKLVSARGSIMGRVGEKNPGGMVAILGLELSAVQDILAEIGKPELLSIGNHNSGQQAVISGAVSVLKEAADLALTKGGKAIPLNVSIANHSPLMNEAVADFEKIFAGVKLHVPETPVIFNVTASVETDLVEISSIMAKQIVSTVRWFDIINKLVVSGVDTFIEVGPKKVLSGLFKRIIPRGGAHKCLQVDSPASLQKCMELLS